MTDPHSDSPPLRLRAAWALPIDGEPIRDAVVELADGLICSIAPAAESPDAAQATDLGDVVLLPGLVNAHAHLEFSDLAAPLGKPGMTLPEWIGQVFAYRAADERPPLEERIRLGLKESAGEGVTLLADVLTADATPDEPLAPEVIYFRELIGLDDAAVANGISRAASADEGLCPHAPYTVRRDLLARLARISAERRLPLMMHVAETQEELQLLAEGSGPFADLLQSRGVWPPDNFTPGLRPLDYLKLLAEAFRALVVHGNYLDDEELRFLAERRERMTLVFCPRTHAFFGHPPHPIVEALELGVACALGTDGRGSSPDLSLLAEMRQVAKDYGRIPPDTILALGTLDGARALGMEHVTGSLTPGKRADLVAVNYDPEAWNEPRQAILYGRGEVAATLRAGNVLYSKLPQLPVSP